MKTQNTNNIWFDKKFREQLRSNPQQLANNIYNESLDNVEYKVFTNSKDTMYVVFPNKELMLNLDNINVAVNTSTIGSAGSSTTVGTLGSVGTTLSSASTASTAGSVGSVKV